MVRQDILEGLSSAVIRGKTLKQAMLSFYNAGYKKQEIEEAASAFKQKKIQQPVQKAPQVAKKSEQLEEKEEEMSEKPKKEKKKKSKTRQRVSDYGKSNKPSSLLIIVLVIVLLFLIGLLAVIFLFKDKLVSLFS